MKLEVIQPADVTCRADFIRCTPYTATIAAGVCATRTAINRKYPRKDEYRLCAGCAAGVVIEANSGGPVTLGKFAGKDDRARKNGGKNGVKTQRRQARARWEKEGKVPKGSRLAGERDSDGKVRLPVVAEGDVDVCK